MKPPFTYYGGKMGMAERIISLMPPHKVYMEPFAGSLAVMFAKGRSTVEIVNDVDDDIVTFFRVLRDQPEDLVRLCRLTPYAKAEYEEAKRPGPWEDLERARRFWCRVNQSFAKTAALSTGWSITTARTQSGADSTQGRIDRFLLCAERLSHVEIEHCDAADLVKRLATSETCIYADPPYLASTRVMRRSGASDYSHDMADEESHERLADTLHATEAAVVLSGYPSPLYDSLYGDWWTVDIPVLVHSSNATTTARAERIERLWTNREPNHGQFDFTMGAVS